MLLFSSIDIVDNKSNRHILNIQILTRQLDIVNGKKVKKRKKKRKKKKVTSFHRNGDIYNNICTALGFSSSAAFRSDPLASWKI